MKQVRPSDGTHTLTGDPGYTGHVFEAIGLLGILDPGEHQIHFAWNNREKCYENGQKRLYFYDNGAYLYVDLGATPPIVETGTWT